jgi:hypothetical protein
MNIRYNEITDKWEYWENEKMIYADYSIFKVCSIAGCPLESEED